MVRPQKSVKKHCRGFVKVINFAAEIIDFYSELKTKRMKFKPFLDKWMLPCAIATGVLSYIIYHFTPALSPFGAPCHAFASNVQPFLVAAMLFLQYIKISPHDFRLRPWHLYLVLIQILLFGAATALSVSVRGEAAKLLAECALLCFICPTASAAGVVTEKMGGSLNSTVTYVFLINSMATLLIPSLVPLVNPSSGLSFGATAGAIAMRIFPMLVLPCLLAWLIRYTAPRFQRLLMRHSWWSFYVWGFALTFAMMLATSALFNSKETLGTILLTIPVAALCCAFQFLLGRRLGARFSHEDKITAGQSLGQKNTGFLIWLGYTYLTPVTAIVGGFYAIFQNLFNSWELARRS